MGGEFFGAANIQKFFEFSNVLEVSKDRMMGTQDYLVGMYYEIESRRFKNSNDEKRVYGWRDDIGKQTDMFDEPETGSDMPFAAPTDDDAPF